MKSTRHDFLKTSTAAATTLAFATPVLAQSTPVAGVANQGEHLRQVIDGFGFSEAFHQAGVMRLLAEKDQTDLLNLMFSPNGGMGYSILSNVIGEGPGKARSAGLMPSPL